MENTINERIKFISKRFFNGNISEMARVFSINQGALRDNVGTRRSDPSYDTIRKIVDNATYNISAEWLITGEGEMLKNERPQTSEEVINLRVENEGLKEQLTWLRKLTSQLMDKIEPVNKQPGESSEAQTDMNRGESTAV